MTVMISVCVATYNGSEFIREQLESVLCQLGPDDEVIVSDDASTDDTLDVIESIGDKRIKVFSFNRDKRGMMPVNLATTNFENALKRAKGDYIFLCDQDDRWHPDKVEVTMRYLRDEGWDYVTSDCRIVDKEGNVVKGSRFEDGYVFNRWKSLIGRSPFHGCCSAFTRRVLECALPFPSRLQSHDRWIGWIATFGFRAKVPVMDNLMDYRRYGNNVSTFTAGSSVNSMSYRVRTRLYYMANLFKRLKLDMPLRKLKK